MQNDMADFERKIRAEIEVLKGSVHDIAKDVNDLKLVLSGSETLGLTGVMLRLNELEKVVEFMSDERKQQQALIKGIMIGLAITSVTSVGSFVAVIAQIFGVAP